MTKCKITGNLKWADNIPVQLCWLLASSWPQNELLHYLEGLRKKALWSV